MRRVVSVVGWRVWFVGGGRLRRVVGCGWGGLWKGWVEEMWVVEMAEQVDGVIEKTYEMSIFYF